MDSEAARIHQLIAEVDGLVLDGRWTDVVEFRDRCRLAAQRGHQWWPAAAWAEYRMALDGPGVVAASVLDSAAARYTLGPFAEVAASTHTWDELGPFLPGTPGSATFAHECIALGDDLRADERFTALPPVFDLPASVQTWEPSYGPVVYHLDRVEHLLLGSIHDDNVPDAETRGSVSVASVASVVSMAATDERRERTDDEFGRRDPGTIDALLDVVRPWLQDTAFEVDVRSFDGDAATVLDALDRGHSSLLPIPGDVALQTLGWIAASGGPHGRRRGIASGRSDLWWALLNLTGFVEDGDGPAMGSADAALLGEFASAITELRWFTWVDAPSGSSPGIVAGWNIRFAVEDPEEHLAWGVSCQLVAPKAETAPLA